MLGREDLAADERFRSFAARHANREQLVTELSNEFRTRTTRAWVELLEEGQVPCGAVNAVSQALADPQVIARQGVIEYDHPILGIVRMPRSPFRFDHRS